MFDPISELTLVHGVGDGKKTACLFSARSLLDGRPFGDAHPSKVLRAVGIRINDGPWWSSDAERAKLCAEWALTWAAPFALESTGTAKLKGHAQILRERAALLRQTPAAADAAAAAERRKVRDALLGLFDRLLAAGEPRAA
jgi:hypothetical protein